MSRGGWYFCVVFRCGRVLRHWHFPRPDIVNCDHAAHVVAGQEQR